ncbi:transposase [Sinorhizobium meliloti]|nr:transposase [Sinorhizobium meliloti]
MKKVSIQAAGKGCKSPSANTRTLQPMTQHQIEVVTSVERRRRWPRENKERLVAETFEPEGSVSEIVRSAAFM